MTRAALAAVIALAGCADEVPSEECGGNTYHPQVETRSLGQLPNFAPTVTLGASTSTARHVMIALTFGDIANNRGRVPIRDAGSNDYYCPELDSELTATVAGVAADVETPAGWYCLGTGGLVCGWPRLGLDLPVDLHPADASVELSDGDYTREFPLGDALAARALAPVGQIGSTFPSGQPITLRWEPAGDLARFAVDAVVFTPASGEGTFEVQAADVTVNGDTVTFTPPPRTGPGQLTVRGAGDLAADVKVEVSATLDVTFTP